MKEKYYIASVEENDGRIYTITLSTRSHGECIVIHGSNIEVTDRAIKIIQALNKEDE